MQAGRVQAHCQTRHSAFGPPPGPTGAPACPLGSKRVVGQAGADGLPARLPRLAQSVSKLLRQFLQARRQFRWLLGSRGQVVEHGALNRLRRRLFPSAEVNLARNRSLIFYSAVLRQNRSSRPPRPAETGRRRSEVYIRHFPPSSPYEARRGGNRLPYKAGRDLAGYFVLFRLVSSHFGPMSPRGALPAPFFGRSNRPKPLISV